MRCTKCGGDGTVDVTRFDPGYAERDVPITCSRCEGSGVIPDEIVSELESKETTIADLRRQVENYREDYKRIESRLKDAHDQLRCPDCKCADQIDAESSECGCDSPICARSDGKTLAESWLDLRRQLAEARGAIEAAVRDASGRSGGSVYMIHKDKFLALKALAAQEPRP